MTTKHSNPFRWQQFSKKARSNAQGFSILHQYKFGFAETAVLIKQQGEL